MKKSSKAIELVMLICFFYPGCRWWEPLDSGIFDCHDCMLVGPYDMYDAPISQSLTATVNGMNWEPSVGGGASAIQNQLNGRPTDGLFSVSFTGFGHSSDSSDYILLLRSDNVGLSIAKTEIETPIFVDLQVRRNGTSSYSTYKYVQSGSLHMNLLDGAVRLGDYHWSSGQAVGDFDCVVRQIIQYSPVMVLGEDSVVITNGHFEFRDGR